MLGRSDGLGGELGQSIEGGGKGRGGGEGVTGRTFWTLWFSCCWLSSFWRAVMRVWREVWRDW